MSPVGVFLIQFKLTRWFVMMRDWKEIAEFCTGKFAWIFGNLQRVGVLLFLETWNCLFVKPETCNLWICFWCDFHSCERWFVEFVVDVVYSCLQQLIWWLVWGFLQNHFDQLTISCLHFMYMTVVCVAVSVDSVVFLGGPPWNGDPWVLFLSRSHSSFPWTGAGETGLKSGRTFGHVLQSN